MKIIYHCYGGAHSSVVAAALHLGVLQPTSLPSRQELMALDLFDQADKYDHGVFHLLGHDEHQNEVYSVGLEGVAQHIIRTLRGLCMVYGIPEDEVQFVDTLRCVNTRMRLGGVFSRALRWISLGRPLVIAGTRQAFPSIVQEVSAVKERLNRPANRRSSAAQGSSASRRERQAGGNDRRTSAPGDADFPAGSPRPKTVYFCYGGTHSSVFCAAYHLGWLPSDRAPTLEEIVNLPLFDRVPNDALGELVYFGTDDRETDVFALGMGAPRQLVQRTIRSFLERNFGGVPTDLWFRNCLEFAPLSVRVGGFLSRRLHLEKPGRCLVARGLQSRWQRYARLAGEARRLDNATRPQWELV